jgi:hypothetical protein
LAWLRLRKWWYCDLWRVHKSDYYFQTSGFDYSEPSALYVCRLCGRKLYW